MTELEIDALSLKLFGKNVNPNPSMKWVQSCTDEEFEKWATDEWSDEERRQQMTLKERLFVRRKVDNFTSDIMEMEAEVMHEFYLEDVTGQREANIADFTLQPVRNMAGKFTTKCVFHDDKHPSCVIYPHKGFYCFSCGAGGNAIDWAIQEFGLDFAGAVKLLKAYI